MIEDNIRDYHFNWQDVGRDELRERVFDAMVLDNFMKTPQGRQIFDGVWKRLHDCVYKIVYLCGTNAKENFEAIQQISTEINVLSDALKQWSDIMASAAQDKT